MESRNVLRLGLAVLLAGLAVSWPGLHHDGSFRAGMVPVHMESNGGRTLLVSRYEVSATSWRQCYDDGGCSYMPAIPAGRESFPITGINWLDVGEYLAWANARSGGGLRLPTLAEWREMDRSLVQARPAPYFTDPRLAWAADYGQEKTPTGPVRPRGSFSTTPDGISDLDGNVWEWTSSCFRADFNGQSASMCPAFVAAGEHEAVVSVFIRNPGLGGCATGAPPTHLGFRLVADLP
jgi:formylglycine-generating enzyme required for sulfatase activity